MRIYKLVSDLASTRGVLLAISFLLCALAEAVAGEPPRSVSMVGWRFEADAAEAAKVKSLSAGWGGLRATYDVDRAALVLAYSWRLGRGTAIVAGYGDEGTLALDGGPVGTGPRVFVRVARSVRLRREAQR